MMLCFNDRSFNDYLLFANSFDKSNPFMEFEFERNLNKFEMKKKQTVTIRE